MPFPEPTTLLFASFFRGWNRLEARSRRDDFALGISATTADPLWALARQWQFLELKGDDAGTPIRTDLTYEVAEPNALKLGNGPYEALGVEPLEVLVEREAVGWDWRMRVRAGQHFERLARLYHPNAANVIASLRTTHCPVVMPPLGTSQWLDMDLATRRFVSLMEGRAIDGETLHKKIISTDPNIPSELGTLWMAWYNSLYSQSLNPAPPAWKPERLDYEFRLRSSTPVPPGSLHAPSYRNGAIDWSTFVQDQQAAASFRPCSTVPLTPVHARFAGQPMRRWWEFEDRAVDFGSLDVATTDLGKLVLIEYALVFGDDWFVVPLTAKPNSLVRVTGVQVYDCFGLRMDIARARAPSADPLQVWEAFALSPESRSGSTSDFLYVPPSTGLREESPILEEIRFARDEDANLVFAIEHTVPNQLGEPAAGFAAHLEALRRWRHHIGTEGIAASEASAEGSAAEPDATETIAPPRPPLRYVLATKVPENWIPFMPTDQQNVIAGLPQRSVKLRRGAVVSTETADAQVRLAPLSRLLRGGAPVDWIFEEAVGREGVRVELRRQRMRSATGETYVWLGRKVGVGRGEARSGLRFDSVLS